MKAFSESKLSYENEQLRQYQKQDLKPRIITKLVDKYVDYGTNRVSFVCEFSQGVEHAQTNWYHNEVLIQITGDENKFLIQNEVNRSILYVLNVDFENSGYYSFKIQNKYGYDVSSANLTVYQSKK